MGLKASNICPATPRTPPRAPAINCGNSALSFRFAVKARSVPWLSRRRPQSDCHRSRRAGGARTRSYSCPAGTTSLPSPSYTAWADTGSIRNEVNTCAPVADGTCPAREFVIGCVVYGYSGTPTGDYAEIYSIDGSGGVAFDSGDSVRCVIGYADTLQANHLPLVPSDANLYRLRIVNADPINDWDNIYSRAEDNSSYVEVFAKKADGTNGDRCYGQAKVMFNYEGK